MYQPPPLPANKSDLDEFAWGGELDEEEQNVPEGPLLVTPEVGRYAMEQAIARLLFHAGFEG